MLKLIFILFTLLSLACQPSRPIPADTLVIGIDKMPGQLDPRLPSDATSQKINKLIYSGLLKKDDRLNLVPDLAKSYTIKDPRTYIFYLKENVYFHNQQQLTSKDVKATYESILGDKIKSPFKASLAIIKSIDILDDHTITFRLKKPNAPFLTLMTLGILPAAYVASEGRGMRSQNVPRVGTGPYRLVRSNASSVTLTRFDRYHGPPAKTKNLVFRVIQDATLRTLELMKGRIELVQNNIPYVLIKRLRREEGLTFQKDQGINFTYMAFNLKNKYLNDIRVRKAIAYAIDRRRIIMYKLAGLASYANSLLSPNHWAYNKKLGHYSFSLEKARRLLDETPFKDPDGDGPQYRFTLTYKTSNVPERLEIAQLIAENLEKIGIKVVIKSYEFGTFYRDIRQGDFDIYTLTWVGLSDADIYYYAFHSDMVPPRGANRGHYINPKLDKLLEASRATLDKEKQRQIYKEIQKIVYDDFVYAPLWYEDNFVFMDKAVQGYQLRPDASYVNLVKAYKTANPSAP